MAFSYTTTAADGQPLRVEMHEAQFGDKAVFSSIVGLAPWYGFLLDGRQLGADVRAELVERARLRDGTVLPFSLVAPRDRVPRPTAARTADAARLWFAPETIEHPVITPGPAGELVLCYGSAEFALEPRGATQWEYPSGSPMCALEGDDLVWCDYLSRSVRFVRSHGGAAPRVGELTGRFRCTELGFDVVITASADRLVSSVGHRPPAALPSSRVTTARRSTTATGPGSASRRPLAVRRNLRA